MCLHKSCYIASPLHVIAVKFLTLKVSYWVPSTISLFLGSHTIPEAGRRQFFFFSLILNQLTPTPQQHVAQFRLLEAKIKRALQTTHLLYSKLHYTARCDFSTAARQTEVSFLLQGNNLHYLPPFKCQPQAEDQPPAVLRVNQHSFRGARLLS